jgi:hypothetical protein
MATCTTQAKRLKTCCITLLTYFLTRNQYGQLVCELPVTLYMCVCVPIRGSYRIKHKYIALIHFFHNVAINETHWHFCVLIWTKMIQKHGQTFRQFFQSWFINILLKLHIVHIWVSCFKIHLYYLLNFTLQSQLISMKSPIVAYGLSATVIL